MKSIPDQSTDLYGQSSKEDIVQIKNPAAAMELQIGQAVLRISNQTDPRLLEQTLKLIEAFSFVERVRRMIRGLLAVELFKNILLVQRD